MKRDESVSVRPVFSVFCGFKCVEKPKLFLTLESEQKYFPTSFCLRIRADINFYDLRMRREERIAKSLAEMIVPFAIHERLKIQLFCQQFTSAKNHKIYLQRACKTQIAKVKVSDSDASQMRYKYA